MQDAPRLYKSDDGNFLQFRWDTAKNNFQSEQKGRPIFDKVLIMAIMSPGQQRSTVEKQVVRVGADGAEKKDDNAFMKYGPQISQFLSSESGGDLNGTPIEMWKEIDLTLAATLRSINVYTVEALAELHDAGLSAIGMGGRDLQKKAKAYLEATQDSAGIMNAMKEAQAENVTLQKQLKEALERIEALEAELADSEEEAPKKRGRPRKEA